MLQLIGDQECDALSLGLPDSARALVCSGPHSGLRAYDPAVGRYEVYGSADRIEVLVEVGRQLAWAEAGCAWWPGDGLLAPRQSGGSHVMFGSWPCRRSFVGC
ncbi:hypothetical protein ACWEO4_40700 [Streptomyces sp. NPDC004393]